MSTSGAPASRPFRTAGLGICSQLSWAVLGLALVLSGCPGSARIPVALDVLEERSGDGIVDFVGDETAPGDAVGDGLLDSDGTLADTELDLKDTDSSSGWPVKLSQCDRKYLGETLSWTQRPSSGLQCYYRDEFQGIPAESFTGCLPWEVCDKGHTQLPNGTVEVNGTLACFRECDNEDCPGTGACEDITIVDMEEQWDLPVCRYEEPVDAPHYPLFGNQPAEGGLDCWTAIADLEEPTSNVRVAVVDRTLFVLVWDWAITEEGGGWSRNALYSMPLETPLDPGKVRLLHEDEDNEFLWTRLRTVGNRLLVFERTPPNPLSPYPSKDIPVVSRILWSNVDLDGTVSLKETGVEVNLGGDFAAPLPGSANGCLVYRRPNDLTLLCFEEKGETLLKDEFSLEVPSGVLSYLDWVEEHETPQSPFESGNWSMAVNDRWIAIVVGTGCSGTPKRVLHYAPYDNATNQVVGEWSQLRFDDVAPSCDVSHQVVLWKDTVVVDGMSARLPLSGAADWTVASRLPTYERTPKAWEVVDDLFIQVTMELWEKHTVWVNRFLW